MEWRSEEHSSKAEAALASLSEEERREAQRAASKAMHLLLSRQRTEKELRTKLAERGFCAAAVEYAITYVASYGYLDDRRYAEVYLHSMQEKKSRFLIRREPREKGVSEELIREALEENGEGSEDEIIYALLCRRLGDPHARDFDPEDALPSDGQDASDASVSPRAALSEKELRRTVAWLGRRGFSGSAIWKQIRRYQEEIDIFYRRHPN